MIKGSPKFQLLSAGILVSLLLAGIILAYCGKREEFYNSSGFDRIPKTDVHFHYITPDLYCLKLATSLQMRLVSPNVDAGTSLDDQLSIAKSIRHAFPENFAFLGTFSVDSFETPGFVQATLSRIRACMDAGASGIKIWKNIGMVLKDKQGRYVMVDDPAFDPIFSYLEENRIPVMGHLGEPRDCWLPLKEMKDSSNCRYYRSHPQYHMYLHPECPSYEDQMNARDNLLRKHPNLRFTGAHIGSMEWSVDEVAKRLEEFPNMNVDLSARMAHLQRQSIENYDRVRNFMIKYQDRILYGTDVTVEQDDADHAALEKMLQERWRSHWYYLATDSVMRIRNLPAEVKGLHLPKVVVEKITHTNANFLFSRN